MEISYVKEFITLVECKYYAEAAEQLFISPSSLTRHIQAMEKEFGKPLFIRTSRKVELTEFGKSYYYVGKKIVYLQDEFIKENLIKDRRDEKVLLGYLGGLSQYKIGSIISDFKHKNPDINLEYIQIQNDRQFEMLSENKCDFLLTGEVMIPKDKFNCLIFEPDSFALVVPSAHSLAGKKKITLSELSDERLLIVRMLADENSDFIRRCREENVYPNFGTIDIDNAIDRVVIDGQSVIMARRPAELWGDSAVSIIDIDPPLTVKVVLVYRKDAELSAKEKKFLEVFQNNVR